MHSWEITKNDSTLLHNPDDALLSTLFSESDSFSVVKTSCLLECTTDQISQLLSSPENYAKFDANILKLTELSIMPESNSVIYELSTSNWTSKILHQSLKLKSVNSKSYEKFHTNGKIDRPKRICSWVCFWSKFWQQVKSLYSLHI